MSIRDYIQNQVFARRAKDHGCLVIYDPERRYREIALAMEAEKRRIVDASESIITQREVASEALAQLASGTIHHLIIWVPANAPKDDEEKQKDPFSVFAGATLALWAVAAIAVFVGTRAGRLLDPKLTAKIAAVLFAAVGITLMTGIL